MTEVTPHPLKTQGFHHFFILLFYDHPANDVTIMKEGHPEAGTLGARQVLLKRCARRGHSGLFAAFRALARDAFCASLAIRGGAILIHDFGMA